MDLISIIRSREAARRQQAVSDIKKELAAAAARLGGRYILYGSAARGEMRFTSDIDLLTDFPEDLDLAARLAAEDICAAADLPYDILPKASLSAKFLNHISIDMEALG
jgi:predicted nucleotidyltransferase